MSVTESRLQQRPIEGGGGGVAIIGEIDAGTAVEFESYLAGADQGPVSTIDMSGVTFMDSSGLRVLIAHHHRLADDGDALQILDPSRIVSRLLEITGLTAELNVVA